MLTIFHLHKLHRLDDHDNPKVMSHDDNPHGDNPHGDGVDVDENSHGDTGHIEHHSIVIKTLDSPMQSLVTNIAYNEWET